jgi:metal-responsive CopG/Arc/MetJ family transcriptional regulator
MKRKKVQITLPEELKLYLEEECEKEFMTISSWVERALLSYIDKKSSRKNQKLIDLGI